MARASVYCRFSPRPDAETSDSNDRQVDVCRAYCEQKGYTLDDSRIFQSPDVSGAEEDRPALWAAIASLKKGDVLVAESSDRLARDVFLAELIRRDVTKRHARIEYVNGHNGQTDGDIAIQQILTVFDALDRKTKAARTSAAMKRHQAKNRAMGAEPPFGKRRGADTVVIDSSGAETRRRTWVEDATEQATIRRIQKYAAQGLNNSQIAKQLTLDGIPCRGKKHWHRETVRRVLSRQSQAV